jgi:hypothetical protein
VDSRELDRTVKVSLHKDGVHAECT